MLSRSLWVLGWAEFWEGRMLGHVLANSCPKLQGLGLQLWSSLLALELELGAEI